MERRTTQERTYFVFGMTLLHYCIGAAPRRAVHNFLITKAAQLGGCTWMNDGNMITMIGLGISSSLSLPGY
jgi:hypothetical protein